MHIYIYYTGNILGGDFIEPKAKDTLIAWHEAMTEKKKSLKENVQDDITIGNFYIYYTFVLYQEFINIDS